MKTINHTKPVKKVGVKPICECVVFTHRVSLINANISHHNNKNSIITNSEEERRTQNL